VLRKIFYIQDVVFREVIGSSKYKEAQMEKEPENSVFELRNKEHDLDEST
jgi:hypothetical protein